MRWSPDPPPGWVEREDEPRQVEGTVIRFMCDYGCDMPLWDEDGPLPRDPTWLAGKLGLSRDLVDDLAAWAADWDSPGGEEPGRLDAWLARRGEHRQEASRLFARLRAEVSARFEVVDRESPRS